MKLSHKNTQNVDALLAAGLFESSDEAVDSIIEYAYEVEDFEEFELDIDTKNLEHLKKLSEKTGAPVNFIFNRIVGRYLDSEGAGDSAVSEDI